DEEAAGLRLGRAHDLLGGSDGDQPPARLAALGPQVDHPVGALDDLEVVLDDDQRVAARHQAREAGEQLLDVGQVEPRGRLVEDEEGVRLALAAEPRGELHTLRLAAGEGGERLPEAEVVEADVGERLEASPHLGDVGEERGRLGDGQLEDVADRPPPEADLEDLRPKARPAALGAGHVDVGEELHLDLLEALAGARLAAAARDVEGEGGRRVAPETRLLGAREAGTDAVEGPEIGDRVGAGRGADRRAVASAAGGPASTTWPPRSPAPGPRSIT